MLIKKLRKTLMKDTCSGKRHCIFRNGFWMLVCLLTSTLLWYYSKFWWSNVFHDENELCSLWTSNDRTMKRCQGHPLSWLSRITNFTRVVSGDEHSKFRDFEPQLTTQTYTELMELLEVFASICEKSSIPWIMFGGSLLGAIRHLGMIPWDADVDVMVDVKDQGRLKHALSTFRKPTYQFFELENIQWKFYKMSKRSAHADNVTNPFPPFVDIFFYEYEQNNTVARLLGHLFRDFFYNIDDVFPTKLRPFEEFMLPTPNKAIRVLDRDYGKCWNSTCVSSIDNGSGKRSRLDCKDLYDLYPFVFRSKLHTREKYILKLDDEPIFTLEYENDV